MIEVFGKVSYQQTVQKFFLRKRYFDAQTKTLQFEHKNSKK